MWRVCNIIRRSVLEELQDMVDGPIPGIRVHGGSGVADPFVGVFRGFELESEVEIEVGLPGEIPLDSAYHRSSRAL